MITEELTSDEFRARLIEERIAVTLVRTLSTGRLEVCLRTGLPPSMIHTMMQDIAAMPEVRSVEFALPPRPRGVLDITPQWLPEHATSTERSP